jgi:hypothetical protein
MSLPFQKKTVSSKKTVSMRAFLFLSCVLPLVLMCGCMLFSPGYTILLVVGDSQQTEGTDARHMEVAAQIAWQDHYDMMKYPFSLSLRVMDDTEESFQWITDRDEPSRNQPTIAVIGGDTAHLSRRLAEASANRKIIHISPAPGDDPLYKEYTHSFSTRGRADQEAEIMHFILSNHCTERFIDIVYHPSLEYVERMEAFLSKIAEQTFYTVRLVEYAFDNMHPPISSTQNREDSVPSVLALFLPWEECRDFLARDPDSLRSRPIIVSSQSVHHELISLSETLDTRLFAVMPRVEYDWNPYTNQRLNSHWALFVQRYQAQTGRKELDALAADTYAAVYTLLEVIRVYGESFEAILEGLYEYQGYGITGPIGFTAEGLVKENPYLPVRITAQGPILLEPFPSQSD